MDIVQKIGIQRWRLRGNVSATDASDEASPATGMDRQTADGQSIEQPLLARLDSAQNPQWPQTDTGPKVAETAANALSSKPLSPSVGPGARRSIDDLNWQELADLHESGELCEACGKHNSVFGNGDPKAAWVFVVESPTARDVENQQLLSGRSGQLFDAILQSVGLTRECVYLSSACKCPVVGKRGALAQCNSLVHRQIELIKPKVVLTMGESASRAVLRANDSLNTLRKGGGLRTGGGIPVVPTYGPDDLLDHPDLKALLWRDLKTCLRLVPAREL